MIETFRARGAGFFAVVLLAVACVAVITVDLAIEDSHVRRVFWFPDTADRSLHAETRVIPNRDTPVGDIQLYIEEIILGPVQLGAVPFIPRNTEIQGVVLGPDDALYLDFDANFLFGSRDEAVHADRTIELLEQNVLHNFRYLTRIVVTIEGQLPNEPRFALLGR